MGNTEKTDFAAGLNSKNKEKLLALFLEFLEKEKIYTRENIEEAIAIVKKLTTEKKFDNHIPSTIFYTNELSCFEAIVKYLKEEFSLTYHNIALMLNRDDRTIWSTYNNSKKKFTKKLTAQESKINIPILILRNRNLGILEAICEYLKDESSLSYHNIALMLNRNDRTIWTAYHKAKNKGLNEKKS